MLDLSQHPILTGSKHWYAEVNQLYHPTGQIAQDSEDLVYSRDILNQTKFSPVLLKEWFYLVKQGGLLVVDYQPNDLCDWSKLEKTMWWLWKNQYEVIFHSAISEEEANSITPQKLKKFIQFHEEYYKKNKDSETLLPTPLPTESQPKTSGGYLRFVCRKTTSTKITGDSIDKWTFGIITNGKRLDWLNEIISSIHQQGVPKYEIIVCGSYHPQKDIVYLPFNQRDDRGWISKKKNLIVQKAKYQNICIIHDRLSFSPDWYEGMKKWGNTFDLLACTQHFQGKRINDWELHEKFPGLEFSFVSLLDYKDWDYEVCQGGQLHISKKKFLEENGWDESLMWKEPEDLRLSNELRNRGHILRCNPESDFKVFSYIFGELPSVPYNTQSLPKQRVGNRWRLFTRELYRLIYSHEGLKRVALRGSDYLFKHFYARS